MKKKTLDDSVNEMDGEEKIFKDETELGQVMNNLDSDKLDNRTGMSSIDFNARLTKDEIDASLIIDELTRMGILPPELALSRQKKRLSVSLQGLGRTEKVQIVQGDREARSGGGMKDRFFNMFKPQG